MRYSATDPLLHKRAYLGSIWLSTAILALCMMLLTGCRQKDKSVPRIEQALKQLSVAEPEDTVDVATSGPLVTAGSTSLDGVNTEIDGGPVSLNKKGGSDAWFTIRQEADSNGTVADCDTTDSITTGSEMRIYLERKSGKLMQVAATRTDTLGFVLRDVLPAPGDWSFVSAESPMDGGDGKRHLRYHCYWQQYGYQGCGKPESIGNPPVYDIKEDILIHFAVSVDRCDGMAEIQFDGDHPENTIYAGRFLAHHEFPSHGVASIKLRKVALE